MSNPTWSAGYVADAPYTLGFYREMGPEHLAFVALINGYAAPLQAGMRYCELGCGRGYGTLLFAAANPDRHFVGIDFNPAHIQEAKDLAKKAGVENVRFVEMSFTELAQSNDPDLTDFDVVALHGVYSWVSKEVANDIRHVLRRHLKPGGLCYVSYNTMPGWAQIMPIQRLMREIAHRTPGDSIRKFSSARKLLEILEKEDVGYLKVNSAARSRVAQFPNLPLQYLVHEYMNENWNPLFVTEVMEQMAEAKLSYAGSASVIENRVAFNVPQKLMQTYTEAPDLGLRELLKDFFVNQQFRRDVYIKGGVRLGQQELEQHYEAICLVQFGAIPDGVTEWPIPVGTARPKPNVIPAVLEAVADGPTPIGTIRAHCEKKGVPKVDLPGVLEILINAGVMRICRSDHASLDREPARKLNRAVFELALGDDTHRFLASPVLGSAIYASYTERLLGQLLLSESLETPVTAFSAYEFLQRHGKQIKDSGTPVDDLAAAQEKLSTLLAETRNRVLPTWRRLGIDL
ncbi:MAG: class I SAM-dependent methyltransferase [Hyphomicrobiaceae bacterium]